jgi:hypothetical protein
MIIEFVVYCDNYKKEESNQILNHCACFILELKQYED